MLPANAKGMSKRDEEMPAPRAMLTTMGNIRATVPVLLTKAPTTEVVIMSNTKSRVSLLPANPIMLVPIRLAKPVPKMPPPTTKRAAIIITMGLENPANASSGLSTPVSTRANAAHTATRSERMRPLTKSMAEMARIIRV